MKLDSSAGGGSAVPPKNALLLECSVKTKHPLWNFVYGKARSWTVEVAQNIFVVVPVQIEDYCGSYTKWAKPEYGQPICTKTPLTGHAAAQCAFAGWAQTVFDDKWQLRKVEEAANAVPSDDNSLVPTKDLVNCVIEAYSLGDTTRALARARLKEIETHVFSITPFYLRGGCGPLVPWQSPVPGNPIQTTTPITHFDEAHDALAWWATRTFAANRRQ
jgi:hypothetical protein